ncbi:MAG: hypothetical protein FJ119_12270 [Deltaproteobacteria bacterium]|nr:hypothetical protein [Deltaproteobacteria bacterium]
MNIFDLMRHSTRPSVAEECAPDAFGLLEQELSEALNLFWITAQEILNGSGIRLLEKPAGFLKLENNFFQPCFCIPIIVRACRACGAYCMPH